MKTFIAGVVFATAIAPILDSAVSTIMTGLELIKGKWSVKIAEYNCQIQSMSEEPNKANAIGFAIPEEKDGCIDD